jgi:hypothetical protein
MLELSKRLGLCLGIAASFCLASCGGDSGSSGGSSEQEECSTNDDCKDVAGKPVCDTDKRECVADSSEQAECKEDADCKDSSKPKCNSGKCEADTSTTEPECSDSKPCGDGKKCDDGKCVADGGGNEDECKENSDCEDGKTCEGGKCVDDGGKQESSCAATETKCDDGCFELKTDKTHCGDCGKKCDGDLVCVDGNCVKECSDELNACGDECVNFMTDDAHCGNCTTTCDTAGGQSCQAGVCKKKCDPGFELCENDNNCYNLDSNETCGTCESRKACDATKGESCSNRACVSLCSNEGETFCNNECVNFQANVNNCGGCGEEFKCKDGEKCSNGVCSKDCGSDLVDCNGNCIDPKKDPNFCGANEQCAEGSFSICGEGLSCNDSKCVCTKDTDVSCKLSENESICTDPKVDNTHCGCGQESDRDNDDPIPSEGINCAALPGTETSICENGTCKLTCDANHADCDGKISTGCEADLNDVNNCGKCGNVCADDNADKISCVAGECQFECKNGMKTCDGKCTDVLNDKNNCGWCGIKCADNATCQDGFCVIGPENCDDNSYVTTKIENASGNMVDVKAYCIFTKEQFLAMRDKINDSSIAIGNRKYPDTGNSQNAYILMQPIDLGSDTWKPIGMPDSLYFSSGVFIGNGQKITGKLTLNTANNNGLYHSSGLFGDIVNSTLYGMNIELEINPASDEYENVALLVGRTRGNSAVIHSKVKGSLTMPGRSVDTGLVIGSVQGTTTIKRIEASGSIKSGGRSGGLAGTCEGTTTAVADVDTNVTMSALSSSWNYGIGGLIGYIANTVTIENCTSKGTITDNGVSIAGMGGLIGRTDQSTVVSKSSSSVKMNVPSSTVIGGLVGAQYHKLTISESSASGQVDCKNTCGGLVARTDAAQPISVDHCFATGNVNSQSPGTEYSSGGLIGWIGNGSSSLANSYATGNVKDTKGGRLGGLMGYTTTAAIQNCYATGNVEGAVDSQRVGGLIGQVAGSPKFIQVYATGSVKGGSMVGGLIGDLAGGELSYSAATGNVENVSSLLKEGAQAGGLLGRVANATVVNCMALGNVTGKNAVGSVVGVSEGATTIRNVYGAGKVSANTFAGGFAGKYAGASGESLVMKKSYFWEKAASSALGQGSATATDPSVFPFKYNDDKDPVLSFSPTQKIVTQLGESDWVSTPCDLKSGPEEKVNIPMLKVMVSNNLCK